MGSVFVIRHGQTAWSAVGRHTGRTDLPLTGMGRRQGEALGRMLSRQEFAFVLTSPLLRARVTCELAGLGSAVEVDADLSEWHYGEYEGLSTEEIRRKIPAWSVWTHPIESGESLDEVAARIDRVIRRVKRVDGDVAVFGHSHALRIMAARWLGLEARKGSGFILETAAIGVLGWDREFPAIVHWNECCQPRAEEILY